MRVAVVLAAPNVVHQHRDVARLLLQILFEQNFQTKKKNFVGGVCSFCCRILADFSHAGSPEEEEKIEEVYVAAESNIIFNYYYH